MHRPSDEFATGVRALALALFLVLSVAPMPLPAPTFEVNFTRGIVAANDTSIDNFTGVTHGSDPVIFARSSSGLFSRVLLWFDVLGVPSSATIDDAALNMWQDATPAQANVSVFSLSSAWNESADWTYLDGAAAWASQGGDFSPAAINSTLVGLSQLYYVFNVTSAASSWVSSPSSNFGLLLTSSSAFKNFSSFEGAAANIPYLYLRFTCANAAPLPASYSSNVTSTLAQRSVMHSVRWLDVTGGLSGFVFSSNYSGVWENDSFVAFSGLYNYSNVSKLAPSTPATYAWIAYANDSSGSFNSTPVQYLTVATNTAPFVASASMSPSNPIDNESLNCSWVLSDPDGGQALFSNVTWFSNGVPAHAYDASALSCANGTACYSPTLVPDSATTPGQNWTCEVSSYDDLGAQGLANASGVINYFVTLQPGSAEAFDTYITNSSETDFSTSPQLRASYVSGGNESALLWFDTGFLSGATISQASVSVYLNGSASTSNLGNLSAHNVTSQWNASASWSYRDGVNAWSAAGGDYGPALWSTSIGLSSQFYSLDVSGLVSSWLSWNNYGMMLRENTLSRNKSYISLDNSDLSKQPQLSLRFVSSNKPPYSTANSTNLTNPVVSGPMLHSVRWTDYTGTLSGFVFSSNYSSGNSTLMNSTFEAFASGGNADWSNVSVNLPSSAGTYAWRIYANDSSGSFNSTRTFYVSVAANRAPKVYDVSVSPPVPLSSDSLNCSWWSLEYDPGQPITVDAAWYLNGAPVPYFNTTGKACANNSLCYADYAVPSSNLSSGDRWDCRVAATDGFSALQRNSSAVSVAYERSIVLSAITGIDSYISSWAAGPFAGENNVSISTSTNGTCGSGIYCNRTLLYFNLSTLSGVFVHSANLTLSQVGSSTKTLNISVYNVTEAWNASANWTHRDGVSLWSSAGGKYDADPVNFSNVGTPNIPYAWNVTALVRSWTAGFNYGLEMVADALNHTKWFASGESGSGQPQLDLMFTDAKPVISNVSVSPAYALDSDGLNCSFYPLDYDSPSVRANFTWFMRFSNGTYFSVPSYDSQDAVCANSTACYSPVLVPGADTALGDWWFCQVSVYDNSGGYSVANGSANVSYFQTFQPDATAGIDAYISSSFTSTAFGASTLLRVDSTFGVANRSLAYFDVSAVPANSTVANATLFLYVPSAPSGSLNVSAHSLNRSFTESATWSAYDGASAWTSAGATGDYNSTYANATVIPGTGWVQFLVTSAVQRWVDNASYNHGLLLRLANEGTDSHASFYSSDYSADPTLRPRLEVKYVETPNNPPAVSSVAISPSAPQVANDLNCSWIVANDEPNQLLVANVTWFKNDAPVTVNDSIYVVCLNATPCYATVNLSHTLIGKADLWKCQVTALDSLGKSASANSSAVSVENTPPTVPSNVTPQSGSFDNFMFINCSGSTDPNGDAVTYFIDANYSGAWHTLAESADGAYNWSLLLVPSQSGVDIRCNASDGTGQSAYAYASNFTSNSPSLAVAHDISFGAQTQVGNASNDSFVQFRVNVSGASSALCNYTSLPSDRVGDLFVRNETDGSNASITNTTASVWWSCSLPTENYTVFFYEPAPVVSYEWAQNASPVSNFSLQFLYAQVNVSNPSPYNAYSNVRWDAVCLSGFSCDSTGGYASLAASAFTAVNVSASGDGITETWLDVAQNETDPAHFSPDSQKIYEGLLLSSGLPVSVTAYTGVKYPPASCWNSTRTDDAPSANVTVVPGDSATNDSVYWVGDCIGNSSNSFSSAGTSSNESLQIIRRQLNFSNNGGANLSFNWTISNESSACWSTFEINGTLGVPSGQSASLYANQSGDCIDSTSWGTYSQLGIATLSSQRMRKTRTVTNNAGVQLSQISWSDPDGLAPCWTVVETGGSYSVPASSEAVVNMTQQGACLNASASAVYEAVPDSFGNFNTSLTVVAGALNVTNSDNHTSFSATVSIAKYPADCITLHSSSASATIGPLDTATVYSVDRGSCVSNSTGAWAANYSFGNNLSSQAVWRQINFSNALNLSLSPLSVSTSAPSGWSCEDCSQSVSMESEGNATVNFSASGDLLAENVSAHFLNNTNSLSSLDGSAPIVTSVRSLNVTNGGGIAFLNLPVNMSAIGAENFSRSGGNWTCATISALNVSVANSLNRFWEICSSNDTISVTFPDAVQDPGYNLSVDSGLTHILRNITLSNADWSADFSVNVSQTLGAGWSSAEPWQMLNVSSNASAVFTLRQSRPSSEVFSKSFSFTLGPFELNTTIIVNNTESVNFSNATYEMAVNGSAFGPMLSLFADNSSAGYVNITPASESSACNSSSPSYSYFSVNDALLGVCSQDRDLDNYTDYFKVLIPHFSTWNFTVISNDTFAPVIFAPSPSNTSNRTPVLSFYSNEPAECLGNLDADAGMSNMTLNFTAAPLSNLSAQYHYYYNDSQNATTFNMSFGRHTLYARCRDHSNNSDAASYSWTFLVEASCGDGMCTSGQETCSTCAADCGACPAPAAPGSPGGGGSGAYVAPFGDIIRKTTPTPNATATVAPSPTPTVPASSPTPTPSATPAPKPLVSQFEAQKKLSEARLWRGQLASRNLDSAFVDSFLASAQSRCDDGDYEGCGQAADDAKSTAQAQLREYFLAQAEASGRDQRLAMIFAGLLGLMLVLGAYSSVTPNLPSLARLAHRVHLKPTTLRELAVQQKSDGASEAAPVLMLRSSVGESRKAADSAWRRVKYRYPKLLSRIPLLRRLFDRLFLSSGPEGAVEEPPSGAPSNLRELEEQIRRGNA